MPMKLLEPVARLVGLCEETANHAVRLYGDVSWHIAEKHDSEVTWRAYQDNPEYRLLANKYHWDVHTSAPIARTRDEWEARPHDRFPGFAPVTRLDMIEEETAGVVARSGTGMFLAAARAFVDAVPAGVLREKMCAGRCWMEEQARGYSHLHVWNVDTWVHRTLPTAIRAHTNTLWLADMSLANNAEEAAYRIGWGAKAKDYSLIGDEGAFPQPLHNLVREAYQWLADNAEEVFPKGEPAPASMVEWASLFAALLRKMRAGSHAWPGEAQGYATPEEWDWELDRLAERADMYAKTGEAGELAHIFGWLGKEVWLLWD